jgi:hypothetical protein
MGIRFFYFFVNVKVGIASVCVLSDLPALASIAKVQYHVMCGVNR